MSQKRVNSKIERKVALCYVRQSYTIDENDKDSPERQRVLIEQRVKKEGWIPEWYEDADGHKSGRSVKNRPGWLRLEKRLGDPDVVALVAYDPARLHRKGWRIGSLLEQVESEDIQLVFVAPGFDIDTTTPSGRMMVKFMAMFDENYADDVSKRTKAAIMFLRAQSKTVGRSPFGTVRSEDGYLVPSVEGTWFLPETGMFEPGEPDQPPQPGAVWRSYYECAGYILQLYAEDEIGMDKIAYRLNTEGWPFRDHKGIPRPITQDDIRRVIANWPEYGGMVPEKRAKDRPAYLDEIDPAHMIEERAVFPLDLLRQVAAVRKQRTREPKDNGIQLRTRAYPLSTLVYCAHCDRLAEERQDPRLRVRLTGLVDPRNKRRYKHKPGVTCGCTNRTVPADEIEAEFGRLLKLLTIKEEALDYMLELAIQSQKEWTANDPEVDPEQEKRDAIALCQRRIDAAVHLYGDGRVTREEYLRRVEANEREIAHWEARTTETEQKALELAMCIQAVNQMAETWEDADDEDKQGMAQHLFTEVIFDLDTRRIVSYQLKPWADDFLMLRMELYHEEFGDLEPGSQDYESALEKANSNTLLGCWNAMPHRGFEDTACFDLWLATFHILEMLYDTPFPDEPQTDHIEKIERNAEIIARYKAGETGASLAQAYGISEQRVNQIVHGKRK